MYLCGKETLSMPTGGEKPRLHSVYRRETKCKTMVLFEVEGSGETRYVHTNPKKAAVAILTLSVANFQTRGVGGGKETFNNDKKSSGT